MAAHRLPVLQPDVHADRLLLQGLDLAADGGQVALEAAQHALHPLKEREDRQKTTVGLKRSTWLQNIMQWDQDGGASSYLQYGVTGGDLVVQESDVLTLFDV